MYACGAASTFAGALLRLGEAVTGMTAGVLARSARAASSRFALGLPHRPSAARRGSAGLLMSICTPQAEATIEDGSPGTGDRIAYVAGVALRRVASWFPVTAAASYVIQTAPCSSECTAFSSGTSSE